MCKLVENTYRDINIAYANELSMVSEKLKINVWKLIELSNLHPRVNILKPGPGRRTLYCSRSMVFNKSK